MDRSRADIIWPSHTGSVWELEAGTMISKAGFFTLHFISYLVPRIPVGFRLEDSFTVQVVECPTQRLLVII